MAPKKATIIVIILMVSAIALTVVSSGALSAITGTTSLPATGRVVTVQTSVNLGIYQNSACTQNATALEWGELYPGQNVTKTIWIKNLGEADAKLSLSATGWAPSNAYTALELSWNSGGKTLAPNEVIQATLTLTVSPTADASITAFSFDVQITGTAS